MTKVVDSKTAFNPYRQERVNCADVAKQFRRTYSKNSLPKSIDPGMTNILVREVRAHNDVITNVNIFVLDDLQGLTTCSKDNRTRNWSLELDLLGTINLSTDRDDPKWQFRSQRKQIKREEEIEELEQIMDEIDLDLEGERRKLIVDDSKIVKKEDTKKKSRLNWFKMQEERQKQEQELREKMQ